MFKFVINEITVDVFQANKMDREGLEVDKEAAQKISVETIRGVLGELCHGKNIHHRRSLLKQAEFSVCKISDNKNSEPIGEALEF